MPEASLHVTLAFLGERPEGDVARVAEILAREADGPAPALVSAGAVALPARRPRVAALKLAEPGEEGVLAGLQARVAGDLADAGLYAPERRAFLAHVTVGRARDRRPGALPAPPDCAFAGSELVLYRSQTGGGGARYERLATAALSGR